MQRFYDDEGMNFAVLLSLGFAYANIADVGETLATIERIPNGDAEAWVREWTATADRLVEQADQSLAGGHTVSGRSRLLRASTYYDHASAQAPGSKDPSRYTSLWEKHRSCWDRAIQLFETPVEPIEIPYEGTTMAGYFFTPDASSAPRPRPSSSTTGPTGRSSRSGASAAGPRSRAAGTRSHSTGPARARPCTASTCTSGTTGRRSSRRSSTTS
jgi:hypothetical protein